jgi:hypothetical protein
MDKYIVTKCCKETVKKTDIIDRLSRSTMLFCINCTDKWTEEILKDTVGKDSTDFIMNKQNNLLGEIAHMRTILNDRVRLVLLDEGLISKEDAAKNLQDISTDNPTVRRLIDNFISIDEERDCTWFSTEHYVAEYESFTRYHDDTGYTEYNLFKEDTEVDRLLYDKLLTSILGDGVHDRCWMCRYILVIPDGMYCIRCDECKANVPVDIVKQLYDCDELILPWYDGQ